MLRNDRIYNIINFLYYCNYVYSSLEGCQQMIFLYIAFGLFLYFLFMWLFRLIFLILFIRIVGNVKKKIELDIKEKVNNLKGAVKENVENMSNL